MLDIRIKYSKFFAYLIAAILICVLSISFSAKLNILIAGIGFALFAVINRKELALVFSAVKKKLAR